MLDLNGMSDKELVRLASAGDMKAIEVLYSRHYELLLNFGMKYFSDIDFVKDCIQDLFVKLICSPHRFRDVMCARSWLLFSLRNIIYDRLKALKPHCSLDELPFIDMNEEYFLTTIDEGTGDEDIARRKRVMGVFGQLSGNQRMAIYLKYAKGLSHKEVAAIFDINEQSSMNMISRAIAKIRRLVGDFPILSWLFF